MKNKFSRRNFLQTAAIGATASLLPTLAEASSNPKENTTEDINLEMPKRRLGRTNRMVSSIGFGGGSRYCNWVADDKVQQKLIDYAIKLGITYWDTARAYGDGVSEERYGKFLTPKYRDQIFLNSKTQERTYDGVMRGIETSLKALKTDHLDLYTMHAIDHLEQVDALLNPTGGYKAFLKLKAEGVVKNIAFSFHKWNEASQKSFKEFDIDAVLCPINASKDSGNEDNLIPLALKRDVAVIAIKILGQNALIGNVTGDDLVRYALSLPISVANVGMDGFPSLESTVKVGKEPLISKEEADQIHIKLNFDPKITMLPYFRGTTNLTYR